MNAAAVLQAIKGHVPMLLRHPCGASVVDELYNVVPALQRNHLAAEFYGKEYTLLSQVRRNVLLDRGLEVVAKKLDSLRKRIINAKMSFWSPLGTSLQVWISSKLPLLGRKQHRHTCQSCSRLLTRQRRGSFCRGWQSTWCP